MAHSRKEKINTTEQALRERMKELDCLYEMVDILVNPNASVAERMAGVVERLPRAWQFPEIAIARITLDDIVYQSANFVDIDYSQGADIVIDGHTRGVIEVGYRSADLPEQANNPFLDEERKLIENIAHQIAVHVQRHEIELRQKELEAQVQHADRLATIGQLASGVAHEMNDPLSGILGFAQLALKAPNIPPTVEEDLNEIVAASLRAREIVKKLLLFARQTPPQKSRVALNPIVEDALFLLEAGCDRPGIKWVRELCDNLPTIDADPVQVRQVIVNLAVNAMQAVARDGTVTVQTETDDSEVMLTVTDTGCGMRAEMIEKIFTPFFTTKDVGEGTGLGLSVVHGIVTAHGGTIDIDSEVDRGTRFTVRFAASNNSEHERPGI